MAKDKMFQAQANKNNNDWAYMMNDNTCIYPSESVEKVKEFIESKGYITRTIKDFEDKYTGWAFTWKV
jgi:hypothetical protein